MIFSTKIASLLLTLFIMDAQAVNHMLIMGGGGEPACIPGSKEPKNSPPLCDKTIFDSGMVSLGKKLESTDWIYRISYNGGHSKSENILKENFKKSSTPPTSFDEETYLKLISDYKKKILTGEITSNDQLVIMINTHGAQKKDKEKTHLITAGKGAYTNLNNLDGAKLVSLDALEELVQLTNSRGIKLGIIDLSCHSGNTMALKVNAPNTCIITSTSSNHYAYTDDSAFSDFFMSNIKKGKTLEMAFLEARSKSVEPEYPMISTSEGAEIFAEAYQSISPYLYYTSPKENKLSSYLLNNSNNLAICQQELAFQKLINQISALQAASLGTQIGKTAQELKTKIAEYHDLQKVIKNKIAELGFQNLEKSERIVVPIEYKGKTLRPRDMSFTWKELLNLEPAETVKNLLKMLQNEKDPQQKAEIQASIEIFGKFAKKKEEILKKHPDIKASETVAKFILEGMSSTKKMAQDIGLLEKKFYDELYRQKQSLNTDEPCRKIVF